nr:ABC transporter substrate-binding protein [Methylomonas fluvii]
MLEDNRQQGGLGLFGLILFSLLTGIANCVHAQEKLTSSELQGRQLYRRGDPLVVVEVGDTKTQLDGTLFPCANCHGLRGEGKREAGISVPAISAPDLFADSAVRRRYDLKSLKQAIIRGLYPNHRPLSRAMPRYAFTEQQLTRLMAYLQRLGTDVDWDPGIDRAEIRLGTLLPLTGALAETGKLLKATLESCIADLNDRGAIYGRKLTLTALDSGANAEETLLALQNSLLENKVFALVSAYIPVVTADMYRLIEQENLPVISPLSFSPNEDSPLTATFFNFLPSYYDQSRALIEYWIGHVAPKADAEISKLAIVVSDDLQNRKLLPKILTYLKRYPQIELTQSIALHPNQKESVDDLSTLANVQIDAVLFLGNAQEFKHLSPLLADMKNQPVLLSLLELLGGNVLDSPDFSVNKALLATPFAFSKARLDVFRSKLSSQGVELLNPGLQNVACKAVEFVHAGLKQAGKQVSRSSFIDVLKHGNSLNMDFMPALEFSKYSPYGMKGGYVLNIDNKIGYSHRSEWVTVR